MVRKYFFNRNRRTEPQETVASQSANASASASVNSSDFGALGQNLQQALLRLVAQANRLQIRCTVREGILLVLTEHLLHVEPDPQHIFIILEQSVRELTPKLLASDPTCSPTAHSRPLPVRLYLRVAGYQQPYAFHSFTLDPTAATSNAPDEAVSVAPPIADESATAEPIEPPIDQPINQPIDQPIDRAEIPAFSDSTEPIAAAEPIANFTIITNADAFIAEPIDEPEPILDESAIEPYPEVVNRTEVVLEEIALKEIPEVAATEAAISALPTPEVTPEEIATPDVFSESAEARDEATIAPALDQPDLAETFQTAPVSFIASDLESSNLEPSDLEPVSEPIVAETAIEFEQFEAANSETTPEITEFIQETEQITELSIEAQRQEISTSLIPDVDSSVIETVDDLQYSTIADTEISDDIEDNSYQEPEPEPLDEAVIVNEIPPEFQKEIVTWNESELLVQTFVSHQEYTETAQLSSIQVEQIAELSGSENFAVEQIDLDSSEPKIDESQISEGEIDSVITPDITSDRAIDPFAVESTQNEITSISENTEFGPDLQNDSPTAQENHSIAHDIPIEPIPFEDDQTPNIYLDQARDRSNRNGSTDPPFTAVSVPIRLIPAVQDSVSSFDRFPLEVGEVGRKPFRSRLTLANVLLTGAVGLFFAVGGVYVLTRPCVLSQNCEPLQQAQQLTQRALTTIQTNASALEVVDAYDQLTQASQLLETIPLWSKDHQTAQTLKVEYSSKVEELSLVVKALNQANVAAKKSLSPPHPIQVWREVQLTWREAIALLQQVPTDSSVYALAQTKLSEYQSNLESINSRIIIEQNGLDRLEALKKAAEVTDARSQIVNTIESWQQTSDSWKAILDQLTRIPQGTMAHAEAQRLTRLYQLKLEEADNRRSQEIRSAEAYNQAIGLAKQARSLDQQGQWSQAIDYWRQAITAIKQVPEATTYSNQAQTLLNSYLASLSQSEQSVKQITLMQTVEPQLERICGSYNLCTYTLTTEAIRVQLTPEYDQIVVQALRSTQLNSGGVRAETERVNQFLQSLSSISKTAETPVELYSAAGIKLGSYDLNQSDYVLP